MFQDILTAIPLGIFLSFLIGPVFFVLLETSAVKGFRAALVFDLGVVFADIVFILSISLAFQYYRRATSKNPNRANINHQYAHEQPRVCALDEPIGRSYGLGERCFKFY